MKWDKATQTSVKEGKMGLAGHSQDLRMRDVQLIKLLEVNDRGHLLLCSGKRMLILILSVLI